MESRLHAVYQDYTRDLPLFGLNFDCKPTLSD